VRNSKAGVVIPEEEVDTPYIAAKFLQRSIPYTFVLGNGQNYEGFINKRLRRSTLYKIFVRAYVDTPQKHLYTSSPFSPELSLEMTLEPPGPPPQRPKPGRGLYNGDDPKGLPSPKEGSMVWIVGPIGAIIVFFCFIFFCCVIRRRKQNTKQPLEQGQAMTPLMAGYEMNAGGGGGGGNGVITSGMNASSTVALPSVDPVELRRMNFQTPGMLQHPPIHINNLYQHIELLRENENEKFSTEYESIEPGQQFTWENSSMEINKPKNRYANVIAYDHSRVVLQPVDGVPGSDYINSNYGDGYRKQNAYIATQVWNRYGTADSRN
jgi:receptor-type tyrosine-protein phosphatase F